MPGIKLNARDMIIEVSNGAVTPVWTEIAGLTSFMYNPSENEEKTETTTFSDDGNFVEEKMQKGASAELEGFYIADSITGDQDPGQAAVEAWHELLGPESQRSVRFRHVSADTWKVWTATCTVGEQGGGNNDKTSWSATWTRCGASSTAPVVP